MHYDEFIEAPVKYDKNNGFTVSVSEHVNLLLKYKILYNLLTEYMTPEDIEEYLNKKGS